MKRLTAMATSTLCVCSLHKVSSFAPPYFCNDVASPSVGAVFIEDLLLSQYRLHFPQSAMMNQILMMGTISLVLLNISMALIAQLQIRVVQQVASSNATITMEYRTTPSSYIHRRRCWSPLERRSTWRRSRSMYRHSTLRSILQKGARVKHGRDATNE